ncbi:MAG: hypothetical protein KVP17_001156 [Porospora cf. gigantea B]|uniref:uncharacterized protein n=1 Tax=Porospora cf. gigantea B TaxID=2853592 RepID=UPI0035719D91|nr:MAG: hypothetical protein KVP17_001156 [Porospora cf. gigantea B]
MYLTETGRRPFTIFCCDPPLEHYAGRTNAERTISAQSGHKKLFGGTQLLTPEYSEERETRRVQRRHYPSDRATSLWPEPSTGDSARRHAPPQADRVSEMLSHTLDPVVTKPMRRPGGAVPSEPIYRALLRTYPDREASGLRHDMTMEAEVVRKVGLSPGSNVDCLKYDWFLHPSVDFISNTIQKRHAHELSQEKHSQRFTKRQLPAPVAAEKREFALKKSGAEMYNLGPNCRLVDET